MYRTVSKKKIGDGYLLRLEHTPTPTPTPPSPPHPDDPTIPEHTNTIEELADLIDKIDEHMETLMTDYHRSWNKREQLYKLYLRLTEDI